MGKKRHRRLMASGIGSAFAWMTPMIVAMLLAQPGRALAVPTFSTTDLFQGAAINADSGMVIGSAANLFDGNGSFMIFDDQNEGTKFVNFQPVGGPVTVGWFHIYLVRDGNTVDRVAATFHLRADQDNNGSYETPLFAGPLSVNYTGFEADIMMLLPTPVTASKFRLEVTPTYTTAFPGPRVYELDGFLVPEPATLSLIAVGAAMLGCAQLWRRKQRVG